MIEYKVKKKNGVFGECKYLIQGIIGCRVHDLVSRSEGAEVWLIGQRKRKEVQLNSIILQGIIQRSFGQWFH